MAMVAPEPHVPPTVNVDKLSHDTFSILAAQFLIAYPPNNKPKQVAPPTLAAGDIGRVRIHSINSAGLTDGLLAAASLDRLKSALRRSSSSPTLASRTCSTSLPAPAAAVSLSPSSSPAAPTPAPSSLPATLLPSSPTSPAPARASSASSATEGAEPAGSSPSPSLPPPLASPSPWYAHTTTTSSFHSTLIYNGVFPCLMQQASMQEAAQGELANARGE